MNTPPPSRFFQYTLPSQHDFGFSLIEILISLLVLSLGIIGAVKMQLQSIQTSQQSNFYSTAVELASEMAEKIRDYRYSEELANANPFLDVQLQPEQSISDPAPTCYNASCSAEQSAKADISEWIRHVSAALPHARAVICRDSAPWNSSTNSLTWNCASADEHASVVIKLGWAEQHDASSNPPPRFAIAIAPGMN